MDLKDRLALARGYAGLSREDLAARAGLGGSDTVAKLEQGARTRPEYRTVACLARVLCVSVEWLGEGTGPDCAPRYADAGEHAVRCRCDECVWAGAVDRARPDADGGDL